MGKRKSRKKPPPKKQVGCRSLLLMLYAQCEARAQINRKLSTAFNCPYCNHEKSITVHMYGACAGVCCGC